MSTAWKDLERRVCRALGAQRRPSIGAHGWARGTDDDGSAPFAVEVKRTKVLQLRSAWIMQARQNAKSDGRPWLLVIGTHNNARPLAVLDFDELVALTKESGRHPDINERGAMSTVPNEPPADEPAPGPITTPPNTGDDDDGDEDEDRPGKA